MQLILLSAFGVGATAMPAQSLRGASERGQYDFSAAMLSPDPGTPGWLMERLFHGEPVWCPWQAPGSEPDDDCKERYQRIKGYRDAIATCEKPLRFTEKSIGHRGAALVAPEETIPSWQIGAASGAGYLECDVSVTKDLDFTCRHSNCDLQFTTDLIENHPDLNAKCSKPWVPGSGEEATCCTFDFTMKELSRLCSKMDSVINASADNYSTYLLGPAGFRTGTLAEKKCSPLVPYREYLRLLKRSGYNAIPELKDTWMNRTQDFLASKGTNIYKIADTFADMLVEEGFHPWPKPGEAELPSGTVKGIMQTFDHRIAAHWKTTRPNLSVEYMWETDQMDNEEGVLCYPSNGDLNGNVGGDCGGKLLIQKLVDLGVDLMAPAIPVLLASGPNRTVVPSRTAEFLKRLKVQHIGSWSLERQGCDAVSGVTPEVPGQLLAPCGSPDSFYYAPIENTSTFQHVDVLQVLDVLFRDVGLNSLFSDFPATVSMYVNCILEP